MSLLKNKSLLIFSVIVSICFQMTDVKIADIKVSELLLLLMFPILLSRKMDKHNLILLVFFTLYLVITCISNLTRTFYLDTDSISFLKGPYFISISRYLELISCVSLSLFTYLMLKFLCEKKLFAFTDIIKAILLINALFSIFFLIVYGIYLSQGLLLGPDSFIVHNVESYNIYNYRLRGFYFEGGPFGLLNATLFILATFLPGKNYLFKILFFIMVLLAKSKAGLLLIILWVSYRFFLNYRIKGSLKVIGIAVLAPFFLLIISIVAANYLDDLKNIETLVVERIDDSGLVMGRIAGIFIVPEIVKSNPLFGIGLGNYPLVRNNPEYLGIFPKVFLWDEHGLGGLISLLTEGGFIFFTSFVLIVSSIYKKLSAVYPKKKELIFLFILPLLFGVQLHFMYIWFILGACLFLLNFNEDTALKVYEK